ncbi:hypothetical protein Tco_0886165 [Tanacetum coccineum]
MDRNKSYDTADHKRELYDALVKSYQIDKDLFDSYGERFKVKKKKSSSTSKDTSQSQDKSSGKSAHVEEPSYTVEDSGMQQDQEFVTGDNDEKPADKEGGDLSIRYSTSVTKTKAATYELKWIEDLVPELNKTSYTSYSDPHGMIYVDQYKRKRLMRADELHKFSDGTLNDVRSALHDIAAGIRMEYLPMRKWSNLDKKRARIMVQDIDK